MSAAPQPRLDHVVAHGGDWERSTAFHRDVLGAALGALPRARTAYRFGDSHGSLLELIAYG